MSKVTDPALLAELEGQPQQSDWKIPPAVQQSRDRDRLAILEQEFQDNPNDAALQRELLAERRKQGAAAPGKVTDPALLAELEGQPAQQPKRPTTGVVSRVIEGLSDPIVGAAQIADKAINPIRQMISPGASSMEDVVRARDAAYQAPEGIDAARIVGNVLNPVSWLGGGTASVLPRAAAVLAARPVVNAALGGAVSSALAPVSADADFLTEKAKQAGIGSVLGATVAKALRGVNPTPEAQMLMDRGVTLTPGQAAGVGSLTNRFEQAATSYPVFGQTIRNAQRRALDEANVAAAQAVTNIVDSKIKLGLPPREAIERTRDAISKTYDEALENMNVPAFMPEASLLTRMKELPEEFPLLSARDMRQIERFINVRMADLRKNSGGMVTGPQMKQLDSEIGDIIRNLRTSANAADKTAAPAWAELQQMLRDTMTFAQPDPVKLDQLKNANRAYRQLLVLERSMLPGAENFTPRQLARQVAKAKLRDTEAPALEDISAAMSKTLPNTVPDSGTAERLLATALPGLLVGGGYGAQQFGLDTLGTGMMVAGALGSRPGARLLTGNTRLQRALRPYDATIAAITAAALRNANRQQQPQSGNE